MKLIISVKEARKLLGKDAEDMSDDEIVHLIATLNLLAKDTLQMAREQLRMKRDAKDLANLIYDVYKEN